MDSFELNKIIGAILGTLLFVMGIGFLAEAIYAPITSDGPSYDLPKPAENASATPAAAAPAVPLAQLLAKADPQAGAGDAKVCQACHDFTQGGPNRTGPNLYGVVGRKIASHPGYSYSDALKAHGSDSWTYENLNTWLTSPSHFAPGTKMTFAGISDDGERADVLAYLRTLSQSPVPFPQPAAAAPAAAAPASGGKAGGAPATPTPAAGTGTTDKAPNATTAQPTDKPAAGGTTAPASSSP